MSDSSETGVLEPAGSIAAQIGPGVLIDPVERNACKKQQLALRRDLAGAAFLQLPGGEVPEAVSPLARRSRRRFLSVPVPFDRFGQLLAGLRQRMDGDEPRRLYGSAGGIYPVQAYVHVARDRVEGAGPAAFFYHPVHHRLVLVTDEVDLPPEIHFPTNRPIAAQAAFTIFLVSVPEAIQPLYGRKSRDFSLIEAGLISQLLEMLAPALGLGLCQIGVVKQAPVRQLLRLRPEQELLNTIVGGGIEDGTSERAADGGDGVEVERKGHPPPPSSMNRPAVQVPRPAAMVPAGGAAVPPRVLAEIERTLTALWRELLKVERVDPTEPFFDLGGTSLMAAQAIRRLEEHYAIKLPVADLFSYPSIREMAQHIGQSLAARGDLPAGASAAAAPPPPPAAPVPAVSIPGSVQAARAVTVMPSPDGAIAIVGMAGRFPDAPDLEAFWENLRAGVCSVGPIPEERLRLVPAFQPRPGQTFRGSYLADVEQFDPLFFRLSPKEAQKVDPAQRILLELCYELAGQAGLLGDGLARGRTGVFAGTGASAYGEGAAARRYDEDLTRLIAGNMPAIVTNRISHFLDLHGPSVTVDTACSSSLVAVDMACRSLLAGDCDAAIAASVNLLLSPRSFECFRQDGMESVSGQCRTFDAGADGFVRGEGAAAVLLKPLQRALADGDTIHAVIRGSATNHDGRTTSLSVPGPRTQQAVIELAHRRAGIAPAEISYVEAHGTGTRLGDPIELRGLTEAFGGRAAACARCGIGSLKTNLGHLEYAAGIGGLLKVVLALQHRELPPSLHFLAPNPHIDFPDSPFYVVDRLRPWGSPGPRRAAVSSFGVGGTNAHVVVEEAPSRPRGAARDRPSVMTISARSAAALRHLAAAHLARLDRGGNEMGDVCHTLNTGRTHFAHRVAIVARQRDQLCDRLRMFLLAEGREQAGSLVFTGTVVEDAPVAAAALHRLRGRIERLADASRAALVRLCRRVPDGELSALIDSIAGGAGGDLPQGAPDAEVRVDLLAAAAELYALGVEIDWASADEEPAHRRRVPLPVYCFERQPCWWDLDAARAAVPAPAPSPPLAVAPARPPLEAPPAVPVAAPVPVVAPPAPGGAPAATSPPSKEARSAAMVQVRALLVDRVGNALGIPPEHVDTQLPLTDMGMDSMTAMRMVRALSEQTGIDFPATFFFDHPTIDRVAAALVDEFRLTGSPPGAPGAGATPESAPPRAAVPADPAPPPSEPASPAPLAVARSAPSSPPGAIAVIGMAGRFPNAGSVDMLWSRLREGTHLVSEVPAARWDIDRYYSKDRDAIGRTYVRTGGFLEDIEHFDPLFFRLSDREARVMDPQQRLLLEVAWEAVESAGHAGLSLAGSRTGVFIGVSYLHQRDQLLRSGVEITDAQAGIGNHNAFIANRLSYFLNLRGPSMTLDTLCSSSLVAIHQAIGCLRAGQCDMALAGGVHAAMSPTYYAVLSRLQACSASGRCGTFDRGADGYVPAETACMVLLKRLDDALADRDHILAVVRGSAVNHGGQAAALIVPSSAAQADVIREALADAGVPARSIGYLEAHGTGTALGDPIEVAGIAQTFRDTTADRQFCAIGSIKSNIGHAEPAAGVASFVKVVKALETGEIPPTLHVDEPNPNIVFEEGPCYVNDRLRRWERGATPRRAGVSSFGLGGVNAHAILEEAPPVDDGRPPPQQDRPVELLTLSARSRKALVRLASDWAHRLDAPGAPDMRDACFTANHGRASFRQRLAIVAATAREVREGLWSIARGSPGAALQHFVFLSPEHPGRGVAPEVASRLQDSFRALAPEVAAAVLRLAVGPAMEEQLLPLLRAAGAMEQRGAPAPLDAAGWRALMPMLAQLYVAGAEIAFAAADAGFVRRRVPMPTYPFERRRMRLEDAVTSEVPMIAAGVPATAPPAAVPPATQPPATEPPPAAVHPLLDVPASYQADTMAFDMRISPLP